jgi:hypothetical protein
MRRAPLIGFVLSVVLASGAGCGRSRALSVPNGAVLGMEVRPTAVASSRAGGADAITTMVLDAGTAPEVPFLLDASGAPDARLLVDTPPAPDAFTDTPPPLPGSPYRVIHLAVGRTHNCAILDDHQIKCWGDNGLGQLGLGDQKVRGSDPATMGNALPFVDLGTGRTAKSVTAGHYATCAILDDDELKCWGNPFVSTPKRIDVGAGRKPVAVVTGFSETCVARDDGSFLCWDSNVSSTAVAAAADGARVVQLAEDWATIGLFDDGSVRHISLSWPDGPMPLDFGDPATFVAGASTYLHFDCAILRTGGTACTPMGVTPVIPTDASAVAIAITEYQHACGLDAAGVVTCWNIQAHPEWGESAFGTVRVPLGQAATAIGAGDYNGCALLADGTVKCWAIDGTYPPSLGGSVSTSTGWPAVDLGTRPGS